ncbi:hypothetical protein BDZ89DRAFT_1128890 [Hymenopellis radicata]|nr:hypothetical protein BDZ89DRAFT_1128890 [Hymenopellis radicata]
MAGYDNYYTGASGHGFYAAPPYAAFPDPYSDSYGDPQPSKPYSEFESALDSNYHYDSQSQPYHSEEYPPQDVLYEPNMEREPPQYKRGGRYRKRRHELRTNPPLPPPPPRDEFRYSPKLPLSPIPSEPSHEYVELSQQPSLPISDSSSSHKLLILDLNGTLLYREKYQVRVPGQPYQHRVARPRPYMPSFRQFLFHPETRTWLDTMVWSSARPHNVDTMIEEAFDQDKTHLVAVWARDTLGLTVPEYHGKTQTTKNLAKPWAKIGIKDANPPTEELSNEAVTSDDEIPGLSLGSKKSLLLSPPDDTPLPVPVHSASSTLLLDDSPLKARLQPWNHLCIPEYTGEMRKKDVATRQHETAKEAAVVVGDIQDADVEIYGNQVTPDNGQTKQPVVEVEAKTDRVERRKRKRDAKKNFGYDRTLLAVIGVLDTLKTQSNVAAWMRSGGLSDVGERRHIEEEEEEGYEGDESIKRIRLEGPIPPQVEEDSHPLSEPDVSIPHISSPATPNVVLPPPSSQATAPPDSSPLDRIVDLPPSSVPTETPSSPVTTAVELLSSSTSVEDDDGLIPHQMWFNNPALVGYWAERGVEALNALGIVPDTGV